MMPNFLRNLKKNSSRNSKFRKFKYMYPFRKEKIAREKGTLNTGTVF